MALIILIRIAIGGLALWLLWRLYTAFRSSKRAVKPHDQDEWGEVLTAIDKLPETTDPRPRDPEASPPPPSNSSSPDSEAAHAEMQPQEHLESTLLREAEQALSTLKTANEAERLAAYHEILAYQKLSKLAHVAISEETGKQLADIHRQAQAMITPPDPPPPDQPPETDR